MQIKKTVGFQTNSEDGRKGYAIHTECGQVFKAYPLGSQLYECEFRAFRSLRAIKDSIMEGELGELTMKKYTVVFEKAYQFRTASCHAGILHVKTVEAKSKADAQAKIVNRYDVCRLHSVKREREPRISEKGMNKYRVEYRTKQDGELQETVVTAESKIVAQKMVFNRRYVFSLGKTTLVTQEELKGEV